MKLVRKLFLSGLVVGLAGALLTNATLAALSSVSQNSGNRVQTGTVTIADNDGGSALLSLSNAVPGDSSTGCIRTTFTGSLNSNVRLYASVSGSLAPYLTLTVTRGSDSAPSFSSCANFTADATNYLGQGAGVIYQGSLSGFPGSYAAGIADPHPSAPETWTTGEAHSYRFAISLDNNSAAEGQSATASFSWEARNQ
jgi:hypothetical protein